MTTEILRENWQKIEFCHFEAIPDQFQIDLRIAKVWGKAKALQTPKPESDHKMYQNLEFYRIPFAKKSQNRFPIKSGSTSNLQKYWENAPFFVHTCCIYHQIPKNMKFKDYKTSDLDDLNPEMNIGKIKWRQKYLEKIDKKIQKIEFCHSGSILDHFRIDLRIAKVLGNCSFFVHTCCIYHQIPKNMKFKDYKMCKLKFQKLTLGKLNDNRNT